MRLPEITPLDETRHAILDLAEKNERLGLELVWFRRQIFGSKTEHYIPDNGTFPLFPKETLSAPSQEPQATAVSEHERKVRQPNALSDIPADLPLYYIINIWYNDIFDKVVSAQ